MRFDDTDRLLPHSRETFLKKLFYRGSVPMVTTEDLKFIEKYFGADEKWLKLTIMTDAVEELRSSRHGNLKGLEYFGIVKRHAQ